MTSDSDEPLSDLAAAVGDEGDGAERDTDEADDSDDYAADDSVGSDPVPDALARDPDAPLGDLAARVEDRRRERDAGGEYDDLFTEHRTDELDRETLWEQVTADEPTETAAEDERDVREISKRTYCQGCEYFSDPPDVSCGHEGTEILEATDLEHFRVVNCPVVKEDERLGKASPGRADGE
ncbi:hypothetical protein G9464_06145 [Halostella sp. JP-L12]|uniref:hypothetical protein n=1 Tax=Halostella TaxID=1843185 RepID=UPI000EF7FB1B|nr:MULTISPECIES: hypothetical protein [Halostella]NHN47180.1 hypothetical protein [Halostella sp. JP-L12]